MKKYLILGLLALSSCGYTSKNNETIAQVVRLHDETPLICPNYQSVQLSLGVVRNGVGSMSHTDLILEVADSRLADILNRAAEHGKLAKITYHERRSTICVPNYVLVNAVEVE